MEVTPRLLTYGASLWGSVTNHHINLVGGTTSIFFKQDGQARILRRLQTHCELLENGWTGPHPRDLLHSFEPDELRLVALQPGEKHDLIRCRIEHSTFAAAKEGQCYKALSYMWRTSTEPWSIWLEGKSIQVRENLWWALYHLTSKDDVVWICIDALCSCLDRSWMNHLGNLRFATQFFWRRLFFRIRLRLQ